MTNPSRSPESESQLSKAELEQAKATLEANGAYDGLSLPERIKLTLDVGRCINMGGIAFKLSKGQLQEIYRPGDEEPTE